MVYNQARRRGMATERRFDYKLSFGCYHMISHKCKIILKLIVIATPTSATVFFYLGVVGFTCSRSSEPPITVLSI